MTDSGSSGTRAEQHLAEMERQKEYVSRYLGKWVRVTRGDYLSFQPNGPLVGRVIGWHEYDGVVLHVQPPPKVDSWPEPYQVAFEFDKIEVLS